MCYLTLLTLFRSDSDGEGDPDNISVGPSTPGSLVGGCPVTPGSIGPGSVGAAPHNLSVDEEEPLDDNMLSPPQQVGWFTFIFSYMKELSDSQ